MRYFMSNMITGNYNYMAPYASGYSVGAASASQPGAASGKPTVNPGEPTQVNPGRKSSPAECETCKNRKYQDGSDEMVSFKSASHISPQASASRVRAHEQEHVSNAFTKAAKKGGKVLAANVTLKTAVCPECGTSYVAGGTTATRIKYPNETNPYVKEKKAQDALSFIGRNLDMAV